MGPPDGNAPLPFGPVGFKREFAGPASTTPPADVPGISPVAPANGAPDFVTLGRSRLIEQYKRSPKLIAEIDATLYLLQDLANAAALIPVFDDIDQAGGVNLDATAELVGQFRTLAGQVTITDDFLRVLTRLRIIRNGSSGTGPEVIAAVAALMPGTPVALSNRGSMYAEAQVQRAPTTLEAAAVQSDLLPRPGGVELVVSWYTPARHFGWSSDPTAVGFGELTDSTKGGCFAEII